MVWRRGLRLAGRRRVAWLGLMLAGFGASGGNGGTPEWPFLVAKALGFAGFAMFVCGLVACKEAN